MHDVAAWQVAGLYDPAARNAADRLAVLEFLAARGATVDEMVEADAVGRLPVLAGALARREGSVRLSPRDLDAEGVISLARFQVLWRAAGLPDVDPDAPVLTERDRRGFAAAVGGAEFFGDDATTQFTRAVGAAVASIADAAMATFGIVKSVPMDEQGVSELEQAQTIWAAGRLVIDASLAAIEALYLHHVEAAARRFGVSGRGATATMTVGFLDLVGSTSMVLHLDPNELGHVMQEFESHAVEAIGGRGGRLVKTIGDEVMFVVNDPVDACHVALDLATYAREHEAFDGLRGALASGSMTRGYGDFYGPVVNLAARAVRLAQADQIVVDDEVARAIAGDPELRAVPLGTFALRGFDAAVPLLRLERA